MGQHGVLDLYILSQEQFTDLFVLGIVKLISLGRIPTQIKIHCLHKIKDLSLFKNVRKKGSFDGS